MKVSQSSWLNLGLNQQTLFSLVFITTTDSDQNLRKCYLWRHTDLTVLRLCAACQCSNNSVLLRITWIILLLIMMDKQSHRDGRYSSWQCTVPCCVSHQRHLTKRPPQGHSVDTHPHHQVLSSLAPSDSLEATANKLLHLPRGHSSCLSDRLLMSPPPPLPDDRSLPGTGWLLTGRTVCVSTVSSPCHRDQRTSWAPAVSSYCRLNTCKQESTSHDAILVSAQDCL